MVKIYAVIVTYNAMHRGWIDRCMRSISESTVGVDVIIVDNGSTDQTREYVPAHYPDAIWLPQDRNLGFGQANNVGIRYALEYGADYVLLLNQDAAIAPEMLARLVSACDGESLFSPLQLNGQGTDFDKMFYSYTMRKSDNTLLADLLIGKQMKAAYPSGEFAAACWFMPANLIRKIGGFNPMFFQYGEDNNYYQRIVYHKVKTFVVPEARMFHDRELHGNINVYKKSQTYRNILLTVTNINLNLLSLLLRLLKLFVKCYIFDLPHGKYRVGSFTIGLLKILSQAGDIRKSRKAEKRAGAIWL